VILLVWLHSVLTPGQWMMALLGSIIFLGLFLMFMVWLLGRLASKPGSVLGKSFVLQGKSDASQGYVATDVSKKLLVGKKGIALCMLRPSGKVEIEGMRIDAVSDGEFINKDCEVMVVQVEGNRVVVKPLK
jgi:membrane protein implicated in regulation of membrane protease activity